MTTTVGVAGTRPYEAAVESFEITKNKKKINTKFAGKFRVKFEPIGLCISHIRVAQSNDGRIFIELPAIRHNDAWEKCVTLSSRLHGAMKEAIMRELKEMNIIHDGNESGVTPPASEPLRYDPDTDETETEIPPPPSILQADTTGENVE